MHRNAYFIVVKKNPTIHVNAFADNLKWISVLEAICNGPVHDYAARVHCALDLEVQLISLVFVTKQEDTKKDESKIY